MVEAWWVGVGEGVWVRRHAELDLSLGLVVGERACLVVDTGGDGAQGRAFAGAVREVTGLPWRVALTHAHFDHAFGTAAFGDVEVWAHPGCRRELAENGEGQREEWARRYRDEGKSAIAEEIERARIVLPGDAPVGDVDLGGRVVRFMYPGDAHTDHDLIVHVPDAGVVFAGDLVEQGAPPAFGDAYPEAWPGALDRVLALEPVTLVPGHGEPVEAGFVRAQRAEIAQVAALCRAYQDGVITEEEAVERSPYPAEFTVEALSRPRRRAGR
ncbi:MBL fold metallo-hydrolase [Acrocarpospora phusangensis]|uniref:MBL fold metallo-hydrolase n=1 Tax=Acrocarpospora phusangensis TaxID=1070424 RepID=A0A919QBQ0_9ACTN|nr:MBL fold metallo-hydrolase [Acrocarpospora phusangensis]GIH24463.1 MBL fold metallo-hydrolase [Acrocarpospora phusangensis]